MDIQAFLKWLLASGGSVSAASWILERIPWFQGLTPDGKEWTFFGVASGISVASYLVTTYVPTDVLSAIAPYFLLVSGVFITTIVGKMFHKVDKKG